MHTYYRRLEHCSTIANKVTIVKDVFLIHIKFDIASEYGASFYHQDCTLLLRIERQLR